MGAKQKIIITVILAFMLVLSFSTTALAVTKNEVQAQVNAHGRAAVTGNIFIWFLCAVAFLKISQKIDSFMSSLGVNVGNTGGSMMAELLIASRGITAGKNIFGGGGFGGRGSRGAPGDSGGLMRGGLAGSVGRSLDRGAVKSATGEGGGGIGGRMFASSVEKGGGFANNVIGSVAKGSIAATGSMSGETAVKALHSYMGFAGDNTPSVQTRPPVFSDVEIGGGRITGTETSADNPNGIGFGMYHTEQYMAPEGKYETVEAADGSKWYKQYARDAVEKTPYPAPDGSVAYNESIVQKLPKMPQRKDRV